MKEGLQVKSEVYATFYVNSMEVALNVADVQEVVNIPDKIIQMPLSPKFLMGVFNLRGMILPIINLKKLLNLDEVETLPLSKIAIIEHQGARVGVLFDGTSEILKISGDELDSFQYADDKSHHVVCGAIKLEEGRRIIQVISPLKLISIENIPQIIDQQKRLNAGKKRINHEDRRKCITFAVNDLKLGFEITGIYEIIKVSELEQSPMQSDLCIGMVNLRGQTVPVLDSSFLFSGRSTKIDILSEKRVIVLKVEKELFGLLVDRVECVDTYLLSDVLPIPLLDTVKAKMFHGCISTPQSSDVILLNYNEILSNSEVMSITQGHSKLYQSQESRLKINGTLKRSHTYITFKLDHLFGISIGDVREIINNSVEVVAAPRSSSIVKGVLNLRGKLVTIIDTRSLYRMKSEGENQSSKILIFENDGERFGLVVDNVESIINVDEENKLKVPSMMVQNVKNTFENDIKEIITIKKAEENKDSVLVILNLGPIIKRIQGAVAA